MPARAERGHGCIWNKSLNYPTDATDADVSNCLKLLWMQQNIELWILEKLLIELCFSFSKVLVKLWFPNNNFKGCKVYIR